jgi:hypothetical protein
LAKKEKAAAAVEQEKEVAGPKYVVRQVRIDSTNILRKRVLVTPSVCGDCGVDLCAAAKLPDYDSLNPKNQTLVRELVQKHKEQYHSAAPAVIEDGPEPLGVEDDETTEEE